MQEIQTGPKGFKKASGTQARIVADADGKVIYQRPASNRITTTLCPAKHVFKVGTDNEITNEKVTQDTKYEAKEITK